MVPKMLGTADLNNRTSFSHGSRGRRRSRSGQGHIPSAGARGESVLASPRLLMIPWLVSAELQSSHGLFFVSKPSLFIMTLDIKD